MSSSARATLLPWAEMLLCLRQMSTIQYNLCSLDRQGVIIQGLGPVASFCQVLDVIINSPFETTQESRYFVVVTTT